MDFYSYVLIAIWLVSLWLLGWLVLPVSRRLFVNLPDGGLAAGRMLAIALFSLITMWLGAFKLLPLTLAPLWFLGLPLLCAGRTLTRVESRRELFDWLKNNRRALMFSDAMFVLAFVFFVWIRACHPHLNEFEKPMDSAIMGSIARSQYLPPDNPWLSGVPFTNYYYFGHLMGANLARLLATPIALAYNLIVPAFSAMFVSILWSLCAALTGTYLRGTLAMAMVALLGHFEPLRQQAKNGHWWPVDWWSTSRVIDTPVDHTINEYPIFTLALGDAHAHFFALPLAALVFCTCWALFGHREETADLRHITPRRGVLLLIGLLLGILIMTNTWDAPTYGGLALLCALVTLGRQNRWTGAAWGAVPFFVAYITAQPYLRTFEPQVKGAQFELWTPPGYPFWLLWAGFTVLWCLVLVTTLFRRVVPLRHPLLPWALFLPILLFIGSWCVMAVMRSWPETKSLVVWLAVLSLLVPTVYLAFLPIFGATDEQTDAKAAAGVLEVIVPRLYRSLVPFFGKTEAENDAATADSWALTRLLALMGLLALLAPMLFYIKGVFSGEYRHQDTVFKYVLQAWLLLGTAAACGVIAWWASLRPVTRAAMVAIFLLAWSIPALCAAGVVAARSLNTAQRDPAGNIMLSLDGGRYLPAPDRVAIAWLGKHAKPGETVLEAVGEKPEGAYNEFGRVSMLSGVPTPLGWPQHVMGWGADYGKVVIPRWEAIRQVYEWPDDTRARAALQQLKVRYIFVGELERRRFGLPSLQRMRSALPVVFENGETYIVEVPQQVEETR